MPDLRPPHSHFEERRWPRLTSLSVPRAHAGRYLLRPGRLSRAVTLAELTHAVPIAAARFEHSRVRREPEADLFPASHALGLGIATWPPPGGGMLAGKYRKSEKGRAEAVDGKVFQPENSEHRTKVLDTVIAVADELGVNPGQVAISLGYGQCESGGCLMRMCLHHRRAGYKIFFA